MVFPKEESMNRILIATFSVCLALGIIALTSHSQHSIARAQVEPAQPASERSFDKGSDCDRVTASAFGQATSQTNFATQVTLAVRGDNFGGRFGLRLLTATSNASIIEQQPGENGAINAVTSHVVEINGKSNGNGKCEPGEDCFTTLDRAVLTPANTPGKFVLTSKLGLINGYGVFRKVCGKLEVRRGGAIDFTATPPTVKWEMEGNLCQCQ
jgi:hypothetical protein